MKQLFGIFLFLGLAVLPLAAQSPSAGAPSGVSLTFYIRGSQEDLKGLSYLQGGKALPFHVQSGRRSRPIVFSGSSEFVVVRETRDATGKAQRQEVGKVAIPAGAKDMLLLGSYRGGQLGFSPVNLDLTTFPAGSLRVMNFSGGKIALRFGQTAKALDHGGSTQLGPFPSSEIGRECSFAAPIGEGGSWRIFDTRGLSFPPQVRYLFVVASPASPGAEPDVIVVRDTVTKAKS